MCRDWRRLSAGAAPSVRIRSLAQLAEQVEHREFPTCYCSFQCYWKVSNCLFVNGVAWSGTSSGQILVQLTLRSILYQLHPEVIEGENSWSEAKHPKVHYCFNAVNLKLCGSHGEMNPKDKTRSQHL